MLVCEKCEILHITALYKYSSCAYLVPPSLVYAIFRALILPAQWQPTYHNVKGLSSVFTDFLQTKYYVISTKCPLDIPCHGLFMLNMCLLVPAEVAGDKILDFFLRNEAKSTEVSLLVIFAGGFEDSDSVFTCLLGRVKGLIRTAGNILGISVGVVLTKAHTN